MRIHALAIALLVTACGRDAPLTEEDATRVHTATVVLLNVGYREATSLLRPIDFVHACPEGGTVRFVGEGVTSEIGVMLEFAGEFEACGFDGLVLSGTLDYLQTRSPDLTVVTRQGAVDVDGEVEGRCAYDMTETLGMDVGLERTGTVCGHATDELLADYVTPP